LDAPGVDAEPNWYAGASSWLRIDPAFLVALWKAGTVASMDNPRKRA
jgi:hypothetical protein